MNVCVSISEEKKIILGFEIITRFYIPKKNSKIKFVSVTYNSCY